MDTISFARGVPAPECIPVAELADCARAAIDYVAIDTSVNFDRALMEYLLQRQRRF